MERSTLAVQTAASTSSTAPITMPVDGPYLARYEACVISSSRPGRHVHGLAAATANGATRTFRRASAAGPLSMLYMGSPAPTQRLRRR